MNNINNLSDEEFDELFRHSADERNIDFDEGAWQKMSSLLDQKQPLNTPKSNWLRNATALLVLVVLVSVGIYFVKNKSEIGTTNNIEKSNLTLNKNTTNQDNENKNTNKDENLGSKNNEKSVNENEKIDQNLSSEQQSTNDNDIVASSNENNNDKLASEEKLSKASNKIKSSSKFKNQNNFTKPDNQIGGNVLNLSAENKDINKISSKNGNTIIHKTEIVKIEKQKNNKIGVLEKTTSDHESIDDLNNRNGANLNSSGIAIKKENKGSKNEPNLKFATDVVNIEPIDNSTSKNYAKNSKNGKLLKNGINKNSEVNNTSNGMGVVGLSDNQNNNSSKNKDYISGNTDIQSPEIQFTDLQKIKLTYLTPKTKTKYKKPNMQVEVYGVDLPMPELPRDEYFKKGLFLRIGISPDISTISSNKIDKIGSNFGGLLEYRFNKKFSAQAGIIKSKKYYDAYPDQYTWIWGYSHIKLVGIAATCNMLDFPVNVRYDMLSKGKNRIFTGLGITTYKMLKETYNYDYADNTSPTIKWHKWEGKTGTYYASNLNISIGFEKYVSDKLSFQAEPFLKSPLKSIGFGKVPLITYGMMFSAKYPLVITKK